MMEIYKGFCDAVLAACPRATKEEREEIRRELLDHLEDRTADMMERDWTAEEAAARAVACMGDPAEIGRAWNEQLSTFWLWVGRGVRTLTALLLLIALLPVVAKVGGVCRNLWAQWSDLTNHRYGFDEAISQWEMDERVTMGDFELRFYHGGLFPADEGNLDHYLPNHDADTQYYELKVLVAIYSKNPLYSQPDNIWTGLVENWYSEGYSILSDAVRYQRMKCIVAEGAEHVTLTVENDHGAAEVEFALDWGDAA